MPVVVEQVDSKPVIYFHGDGIGDVNVTVETNAENIITIPQAQVKGSTIHWRIKVAGDIEDKESEAVVVDKYGTEGIYDYLFYEGEEHTAQDILANVSLEGNNITFNITNIGPSATEDVFFWYHTGNYTEGSIILSPYFGLLPLENYSLSTTLQNTTSISDIWGIRGVLKEKILSKGLTETETEDLLRFWMDGEVDELGLRAEETWFTGRKNESASVLYFIPQSQYEAMLPLTIDPLPPSVIRVGLVWVTGIPIEHSQ